MGLLYDHSQRALINRCKTEGLIGCSLVVLGVATETHSCEFGLVGTGFCGLVMNATLREYLDNSHSDLFKLDIQPQGPGEGSDPGGTKPDMDGVIRIGDESTRGPRFSETQMSRKLNLNHSPVFVNAS